MRKRISAIIILTVALLAPVPNIPGLTPQNPSRGEDKRERKATGPNSSRGAEARQSRLEGDVVSRLAVARTQQNNATLVIVAVPGAGVTLTPIINGKDGASRVFGLKEQNNAITISRLSPGAYKLVALHRDYKSIEKMLTLAKGDVRPVTDLLAPIYGELVISGVPRDGGISIDGKQVTPGSMRVSATDGQVTIPRVLEGEHELEITGTGYDAWKSKIAVAPGKANPVTSRLSPARITLTIKSRPGARVYLDETDRGAVQSAGALVIDDLKPASYRLALVQDDYERYEQPIVLDLNERRPVKEVDLIPVAVSEEGKEDFLTGTSKWVIEENWSLQRQGLVIRGDRPGLFRTPSEKRPFNIYRDFQMSFDVRFLNGKGASWIVRARDTKNYYLFQLIPAHDGKPTLLSFYICRNGQCSFKDNVRYPEKLNNPDDSYLIQLEAKGSQFIHSIKVSSNPRLDDPQPLGTFSDSTFSLGGIGFSGVQEGETLVQSLYVIPRG